MSDLLQRILDHDLDAFALVARGQDERRVEILSGVVEFPSSIDEVPRPRPGGLCLAVIPYRQAIERGAPCIDDGTPLISINADEVQRLRPHAVLDRLPDTVDWRIEGGFSESDDDYARAVRELLTEEIAHGSGANFVRARTYRGVIDGLSTDGVLAVFARLLAAEPTSYWTYVVHAAGRTIIGATPERHLSVREGRAFMNPISGTYRHGPEATSVDDLVAFLEDDKEADELTMVVDEELKMMATICTDGGHIDGPFLRPMATVSHTEYHLSGSTELDSREALRHTLFAPTVTGSPVDSAMAVIARREPHGRGYYSGVLALFEDEDSAEVLDSAIILRTAVIDAQGRLSVGVGSTIVRLSDPVAETAETAAKLEALLAALAPTGALATEPYEHEQVRRLLDERREALGRFWTDRCDLECRRGTGPLRVLVVDAEDRFTAMLVHQLRWLGHEAVVRDHAAPVTWEGFDLVVLGPGPGDPRDRTHPKIRNLVTWTRTLLEAQQPFVAVCLSHQVLAHHLGLPLQRLRRPRQGTRREISLFGRNELVGFYNSFAAYADHPVDGVHTEADPGDGEVHALAGRHFVSLQFHPESVLTADGLRILEGALHQVVGTREEGVA